MKKILIIATICLHFAVNAQFSAGVKLDFNYGNIYSINLKDNIEYQERFDPQITYWNVDQNWGFGFGVGAFTSYNFTDNFALIVEPTFDFQNCSINFKRIENKINENGNGNITTETTNSDIRVNYFNLPIMARYTLPKSKIFLQGGFGINVIGKSKISSTENVQKDVYKNGFLSKTIIEPSYILESDLNVYACPRLNIVFGIGKSFDVKGKPLSFDIRYNLPITKSEMFTTNAIYNDGLIRNNDLLSYSGKVDAEHKAPFLLDDFKMSSITLSVSYVLFRQ